jgi:DNA-binding transcriptional ArsR family regulator
MTIATDTLDDRLDLVFQALGNRTRRALLRRLSKGAARVTDLASPFDMSLAAISRHLTVLERAGLIDRSINGRVHSCALDVGPMATAEEWLCAYREFWTGQLDRLAEFVEEQGVVEKSR